MPLPKKMVSDDLASADHALAGCSSPLAPRETVLDMFILSHKFHDQNMALLKIMAKKQSRLNYPLVMTDIAIENGHL